MPIDWLLGSVGLTIVWANVCIEVIDSPPSFLSAMVIIVAEVLFDLAVADDIPSGKLSLRKSNLAFNGSRPRRGENLGLVQG